MYTLLFYIALLSLTFALGSLIIGATLLGVKPKPNGFLERIPGILSRAVIRASGSRTVVHNSNRIDFAEAHVYVSNHVSWFDIFALAGVLPRYRFVAKKELRRIPIFGAAAAAVAAIYIDRKNRKAAFEGYRDAAKQIHDGLSVVVFPEGTRGYDYSLRPFKKGPFVLAIAAQVPVVPCVLFGTREIQGKSDILVRPGVAEITVLDAIPTAGMTYEDRDSLARTVWDEMAAVLENRYGVKSSFDRTPAESTMPAVEKVF